MATTEEFTPIASSSSSDEDGVDNNNKATDYNVFRDALLRYCGYANEVGESFRYQFPRLVAPTYVIAFGYCLADAVSSGYTAYYYQHQAGKDERSRKTSTRSSCSSSTGASVQGSNDYSDAKRAATGALDTLLWQTLASVMIPGATINLLVKAARWAVPRSPVVLPVLVAHWLPTAVGLGSIPLIVHPIDGSVDYLLDNTIRTLYKV